MACCSRHDWNIRPARRTLRVATAAGVLAAGLLAVSGCDDGRTDLIRHANTAASGGWPAGRAAATTGLLADWNADKITLTLAIDHAFALLDRNDPGATVYAGAVLDLAAAIESHIPREPEGSEFLLRRLGRLAMASAEKAYAAGALPEAASLVLAGPQRWQSEPYWLRYTDHDALVAVILAATGRADEARRRLDSRPVLDREAAEVRELLDTRVVTP